MFFFHYNFHCFSPILSFYYVFKTEHFCSISPTIFIILGHSRFSQWGFCIGTTEFVAMGLIQEIASDLQITVPQAGHFISAYALGVVIGAPVIAILGARVPRKTLLLGLMLFYGIANALTALAKTPDMILVSRFIAGFPHGAYFGVGALVAAELAGPNRRASAVAQMMMGLTVATVLGVPLATWVGQQFGWRSGFEFSALIALVTLVSVAVLYLKYKSVARPVYEVSYPV